MTQNTPVEILPGYFYVPIAEEAYNLIIQDGWIGDNWADEEFLPRQKLPPGSFTILFTSDEATEEKWKGVVECDEDGELCNNYHRVHEGSTMSFCNTATESGASLLRSHNLPVEDNFVIVKREK